MSRFLSVSLITASLIAVTFNGGLPAAESLQSRSWKVDNVERNGLLHIPANAGEKPAPVVFAFHGHGGNMKNAARTFRIHELWPEAICVYLQGLNTPGRLTDPEGKKPGWQSSAGDQGDRDLRLFDSVVKELQQDFKVNDKQLFATGHSNGGGFSYLLLAERGGQLAAIASSASAASRAVPNLKAKPVLHIAGRQDPLVKFAWQEATINKLLELNKCETTPTKWIDGKCELYKSSQGTQVVTMIHEGNHKFPSDAPETIVQFFKSICAR